MKFILLQTKKKQNPGCYVFFNNMITPFLFPFRFFDDGRAMQEAFVASPLDFFRFFFRPSFGFSTILRCGGGVWRLSLARKKPRQSCTAGFECTQSAARPVYSSGSGHVKGRGAVAAHAESLIHCSTTPSRLELISCYFVPK
eukprot:GEMP01056381.1.p1 GENE.GEMP01056381.1~~GEMP01056381.1.p1  ORF type:complete len:142 (-),score=17.24 GEMP01056381.1:652-1077(-)